MFVETLGSTRIVFGESRLMVFLCFRESSSQGFPALLESSECHGFAGVSVKAYQRPNPSEGQWTCQIAAWRDKLNVSPSFAPFDALQIEIKGIQVLSKRVKAILNMVVGEKMKDVKIKASKNVMPKLKHVIVDISQNPSRRNFTNEQGFAHTMCTSARLVHLGRKRVVTPREMMWLQGHNVKTTVIPEDIDHEDLRKLAGEGMALPCLGLALWCLCLVKGFCKTT